MAAVLLPSISLAVSLQVSQQLQRPHTAEHKRHRLLFSCSRHSRCFAQSSGKEGIFGNLGSDGSPSVSADWLAQSYP